MTMEQIILLLVWVVTIAILFLFIPKDKVPHALIAFHITQVLTWLFGLTVVQMMLIEYPVRLFDFANRTSFTFEFFSYPALCAIFNVHFPVGKSKLIRFGYYALYTSAITITEFILEKNTDVVAYIQWSWYWTWITLFITFFLARTYYKWFFKKISSVQTK